MKKLIALFSLFTIVLSAFAGTGPDDLKAYRSQQFSYKLSFNKIVVADNIDLVLYENSTSNIQFDGNKEDIANVQWEIRKGILYLSSRKGAFKNKVIVTIDVAGLEEITMEGQSNVRSLGNLDTPELNIYMKGGCFAAIRNTGTINVVNMDETEMNVIQKIGNVSVR